MISRISSGILCMLANDWNAKAGGAEAVIHVGDITSSR
jgi:hypothetical protein